MKGLSKPDRCNPCVHVWDFATLLRYDRMPAVAGATTVNGVRKNLTRTRLPLSIPWTVGQTLKFWPYWNPLRAIAHGRASCHGTTRASTEELKDLSTTPRDCAWVYRFVEPLPVAARSESAAHSLRRLDVGHRCLAFNFPRRYLQRGTPVKQQCAHPGSQPDENSGPEGV